MFSPYDADPLCSFIANALGATARARANPNRAAMPFIDWRLYEERY